MKKLWKKPISPIFPEPTDVVQYTYVDGNEQQNIKILSGVLTGVVFEYGSVKFSEENDSVNVNFDYNLIENPNEAEVLPHQVTKVFGDIIMDVLEREMKQGGLEDGANDRENDSTESHLQ